MSKGRPWWAIAGLTAIALLALLLYTWSLSRNGMANSYYAAAVKSATVSWRAFFFGSLDPGSFITVDKPPLAIWVMALSARIFGFSTWSLLLPQALAGVASVLVLHRLVRRWRGEAAALFAAIALALTPVAVLIFRYNNPDALLTLLLLLAAWAVWSALEKGSAWRLSLGGVALGLAFLTKMLMGLMVLPAFVLVYLVCASPRLSRRILHLLAALGALLLSSGWWIAIVEWWPGARPHVGGTTTDSWIDLIFSRSAGILETASQGANLSGDPGWLRILNEQLGGQVAWLLPLALSGLVAGLAVTLRAPRTDRVRAGYLLWGMWALVMIAVFDTAGGTLHSYYTVVLAPAVAALAGAGSLELWDLGKRRRSLVWLLPVVVAGSGLWSAAQLGRTEGYAPGLAIAVMVLALAGAAGFLLVLLGPSKAGPGSHRLWPIATSVAVAIALVALLAGPSAYSASTVARAVTGNTASAGPPQTSGPNMSSSSGSDLSVDEGLITYLQQKQDDATYLVAVQSTSQSVPIILATGEPVVTIGGYKNRDPYPTGDELEAMVIAGELRYAWMTSGSATGAAGASGSGKMLQVVADWITAHGEVVDVAEYGGSSEGTLYYLGGSEGGSSSLN
jgi:4-amino-4-deoxy-L-arabinose transferase-like glycosyltransferase